MSAPFSPEFADEFGLPVPAPAGPATGAICGGLPAPDFCPTQEQLAPELIALLPRGRAWGEGGPAREPGGIVYAFWWAVAGVYAWLHAQICALALEFVCETATRTLDLWMEQYGLPDGCDAFPNLCAKVAAIGGDTCEFYIEAAAAIGWSITCGEACAQPLGCFCMGGVLGVSPAPAVLVVLVDLPESPAYASEQAVGLVMGLYRLGLSNSCGPDITPLECLLERIVHAEVAIVYGFVGLAF